MGGGAAKKMSDHASMKRKNQLAILSSIRDDGPITRVKLKKKTKLSWGTITTTTKELLSRGIITEVGSVTTGIGRRPVELDLNRQRNLVLGLRLGSVLVRSILVDVKGAVVEELGLPVDPRAPAREILGTLVKAGRQILKRREVEARALAGIGIAAPGAVDFATGVCRYAPHHPQWKDVPLKKRMEEAFGVPCLVDQAYNCFVLSEQLFGYGRGLENFIGVLMGTGLSAGIVINGEVYRGADSAAGEFGHTTIDRDGPLCVCGNNGCIEAYVSGPAIACLAEEEAEKRLDSRILRLREDGGDGITAQSIEKAAREGDEVAREIYARMGTVLGVGLSNLINMFNPQRIILGGRLGNAAELFLPACLEAVEKRAWNGASRDVKVSALSNGPVLGAAALVLQQLFSAGRIVQRLRR